MKLLLDESAARRLVSLSPEPLDVRPVPQIWAGRGFAALVTVDQGMEPEQNVGLQQRRGIFPALGAILCTNLAMNPDRGILQSPGELGKQHGPMDAGIGPTPPTASKKLCRRIRPKRHLPQPGTAKQHLRGLERDQAEFVHEAPEAGPNPPPAGRTRRASCRTGIGTEWNSVLGSHARTYDDRPQDARHPGKICIEEKVIDRHCNTSTLRQRAFRSLARQHVRSGSSVAGAHRMQLASRGSLAKAGTQQQAGRPAVVLLELDQVGARRDPIRVLQQVAGIQGESDVVLQKERVSCRLFEKPLPRPCVAYRARSMALGDVAQGPRLVAT